MTMEQGGIILCLWHKEGASQVDVASMLGKDKTTIARLLDGMEKASLVVRVPSETDKRIKLLYLTQKGKEVKDVIYSSIQDTIREATAGIDAEKIESCKEVLRGMFENLCPEEMDTAMCKK